MKTSLNSNPPRSLLTQALNPGQQAPTQPVAQQGANRSLLSESIARFREQPALHGQQVAFNMPPPVQSQPANSVASSSLYVGGPRNPGLSESPIEENPFK